MFYRMIMILSLAAATYGTAAPLLISVDLPKIEDKKAWHRTGIATYELIGNTAISEIEESRVAPLKQRGYKINILDRQPDLKGYMVVSNCDQAPALTGSPVWRNDKTAVVRPSSKDIFLKKEFRHRTRPFNTTPLPERFWQSITETKVARRSLPADPFVQSVIDQVNPDSIGNLIQRLQAFQTRFVLTDSSASSSAWLKQKLDSLGFSAFYDSFSMDGSWAGNGMERNVIARQTGYMVPGTELILCGHFDSYCETTPELFAPGADDNASGIAATIEAARIFRQYSWKKSVTYACWSGEEEWMWGSGHYAFSADSQDAKIGAVMNMDMIGYMNDGNYDVCAGYTDSYSFCRWLLDLYFAAAAAYVPGLTVYEQPDFISDNTYFSQVGYPAIGTIEYPDAWFGGNPNYHQPGDVYSSLDPALFTMVAKASLATIAVIAISPGAVEGVAVHDAGNGSRLQVTWTPNQETDIAGYQVFFGTTSGSYTDTVSINDSICNLDGLMGDTTYYVTVWALDTAGRTSPYATEITGTPRSAPLAPSGLTATPVDSGIALSWRENLELDLAGYNIYHKIDNGAFDSLTFTSDTFLLDKPLSGAGRFYYKVEARDNDGNRSLQTDSAYSRPITLDQGVLVVDETQNWTSTSFPRDAQQDSFYNYLMAGYRSEQFDFGSAAQKPILADLGPYSTILWHSDDPSQFYASNDTSVLREYLDKGGKVWFTGWKPTADIRNSATYPASFAAGEMLYDYFKISSAGLSGTTDSFKMAVGLKGYPDIAVDTLKYPATSWGKVFRNIEALEPAGSADTVYVMDMKNDGSAYEGKACGVRDSGKVVLFGFPLYYMDREQAKEAIQKVMAEFGEPYLGVAGEPDGREMIKDVRLSQNAPNPFKLSTVISYQLPKPGLVNLKVYNVAGQLVRILDEGYRNPGAHYAKWDGRDDNGLKSSNGVYVYRLQSGGASQTRKMVILR